MKMHELLSDKSKWTRGAFARNSNNDSVPPTSEEAVKFCIMGAMKACYETKEACDAVYTKLWRHIGGMVIWNDKPGRRFSDVHAMLLKLDL